nr:serine hydrolase [Solirubrobacterales bacterium]
MSTPHPAAPRALSALLLSIAALLLTAVAAAPASAAVPDPERNSTVQTGWHWWHGLSAAQVEERYKQDGDRIIDIEVQGTSPLRFAVATVHNSGVYARGWYWYHGLTATQLKAKIAENKARLIDLETYVSGGQRRFAAVMVVNSGDAAKNWHWYFGVSSDTLRDRLDEHKSRLIDLESYSSGGQTRYAAIMIRNSGVDKRGWWWWRNVTLSKVQNEAAANGARTFSLDRLGNGRYNALQVKRAGEFSAYEINIDARRAGDFVSQNGGRIVDLDSYVSGGERRFTAIINDNVDGFAGRVRAEARKVAALRSARFGAWVKQIGGPVSIGLGGDRVFEPASVMKTLHHLYLHTRLEANPAENLEAIVTFPTCPATGGTGECASGKAVKDICPTRTGVTATGTMTLDLADREMMRISDNRTTRAIEQRYGRAVLNLFAASIGALSTQINHDLGCFGPTLNDITLADLSLMHEGATNGTILTTAAVRDRFYDTMNGPGIGAGVKGVIVQEAAAAGKSAIVDAFVAATVNRSKGGSYGGGGRSVRAGFGRMLIPFKVGGVVEPRAFTYGHFYNCEDCSGNQAVLDAYAK